MTLFPADGSPGPVSTLLQWALYISHSDQGVVTMAGTSLTARTILFDAAAELDKNGYVFIRVAGSSRLFDLVAWNKEKTLFIAVRRTCSGGISRFARDVSLLASLVKERTLPGIVQIWVFASKEWQRYQILPGGALLIRGGFL
ncbi:hypothetical protein [Methanospirillum lacunae]|uniref:hypothetical protein n=1 Tax=Methanospirillum lacunae TaxID=668570 RepID=UPI0011B289EF|nr:hypothetical protein [Methanospirillum lacunae]